MALWSAALQFPVQNHDQNMEAYYGLAVHVQAGLGSLRNFFNNPASQASSHLWIAKTGTPEQYLDTIFASWAQMAGNPFYISVELEGEPNEPMTPQQLATLVLLIIWLHTVHGLVLALVDHGGRGITTHSHYPSGVPDVSWGNHPCPGPGPRAAQLPGVLASAIAAINGGNNPMPLPTLTRPVCAGVVRPQNDGYWIVCQDGGIFAFGANVPAFGSNDPLPADKLAPGHLVMSASGTASGAGLTLFASDGGVFTFGDATFEGSLASEVLPSPDPFSA